MDFGNDPLNSGRLTHQERKAANGKVVTWVAQYRGIGIWESPQRQEPHIVDLFEESAASRPGGLSKGSEPSWKIPPRSLSAE